MKITENSQSQFINYVLDFYGKSGIYPLANPTINNKFVERDDVLKAFEKYKPSLERLRCYRLKHYYDLVNRKPEQERFLFGWYKRALSV